jgi:hypothetical protein
MLTELSGRCIQLEPAALFVETQNAMYKSFTGVSKYVEESVLSHDTIATYMQTADM